MPKQYSVFFYVLAILISSKVFAIGNNPEVPVMPSKKSIWVDSIFNQLSIDERIGQLFMVAAYSNKDAKHEAELAKLITESKIGGLIFFQGGPTRQANMQNRMQALAKTKLLIGMDAEWGLSMRLDSTPIYPLQMTYGATHNPALVYRMGAEIAWQCRRLGVHISFSPVVDVNSNPLNPVIGNRSFGENPQQVAKLSEAYMQGLQNNGILANAKHFPGHGDAASDSHLTLPIISKSVGQLEETDWVPFNQLINGGIKSIMVGHLYVPSMDTAFNRASTLSPNIVQKCLREKLNFKGLIITDALNMKGVSSFYKPGLLEVLALKAGNDILLFPENVPVAIDSIKAALVRGDLSYKDLEESVKRILEAKYFAGLANYNPVEIKNLYQDLNRPETQAFIEETYLKAATVVANDNAMLPVKKLNGNFISISINAKNPSNFQAMLDNYSTFTHYNIDDKTTPAYTDSLLDKIKGLNTVIVGLFRVNNRASIKTNISPKYLSLLENLSKQAKVILVVFGNPYSLKNFRKQPSVVCMYEDNAYTHKLAPQIIFGGSAGSGMLPVNVSEALTLGFHQHTKEVGRITYRHSAAMGMQMRELENIDKIATDAIKAKATPGMQVLVMKDGAVVYQKNFGTLTYQDTTKITNSTIYDVASVTKVAATLQAIMYLYDNKALSLNGTVADYLPGFRNTQFQTTTIRQLLTHTAGLQPFIPFWKNTIDTSGRPSSFWYSPVQSDTFPNKVAPFLYSASFTQDSVWAQIIRSPRLKKNADSTTYPYKYSDLSFYFLKRIADTLLAETVERFSEEMYRNLGAGSLGFMPEKTVDKKLIAPTEADSLFRKTLIHGLVHDQGAALLGGVGGHAGLFGNANDLAKVMYMNLQGGSYAGIDYFQKSTLDTFIATQSPGYRGLGWDKLNPNLALSALPNAASINAFGHTGFTGTAVWADPMYNLVFVFLSNRVYPSAENKKLINLNVRTRMLEAVYRSITINNPDIPAESSTKK
jgi:beta-glucosidase-like glycosyl hydrolase/CubicO group peptidase (beta-lactamase class C family)